MSKIVLDIQTDQEAGRAAPVVAACLITSMLIIAWVLQPEDQIFLIIGGVGIAASITAFVFWRLLSEYFELTESGDLEFVREIGKSATRKSMGPIGNTIESVVVQNWVTRQSGLMSLALLGKDGKVMTLEHYQLPDQAKVEMPITNFDAILQHGRELSEAIGVPFQHGAEGEHLTVKKADGKCEAVYTTESPIRPLLMLTALALILLPLTYFAFSRYTNPF
jgi:hypothetical protein